MSAVDRARAALAAGMFTDTIYVLRTALLDDGGGGTYPDPAGPTQYGPFVGAFSRQSGRERVLSSQVQQRGTYRLALPVRLHDPATGDSIEFVAGTDQVLFQGMAYNVVFAPPLTGLNLSRVVELEESGPYALLIFNSILTESGLRLLTEDGDRLTVEDADHLASLVLEFGDLLLTEAGDRILIEA